MGAQIVVGHFGKRIDRRNRLLQRRFRRGNRREDERATAAFDLDERAKTGNQPLLQPLGNLRGDRPVWHPQPFCPTRKGAFCQRQMILKRPKKESLSFAQLMRRGGGHSALRSV